jgi:sugar lactone lactonase YvrE
MKRKHVSTILIALGVGIWAFGQAKIDPTNSAPNPYLTIENWAKMPEGRTWGSTSGVGIDLDGKSVWVAERCGGNSCLGSPLDSVLRFDASGKLVKSFGGGAILFPHGLYVDSDDNIWVTDGMDNLPHPLPDAAASAPLPTPPAKIMGHQVFKYSPDGKLLMTLGKPGGNQPGALADPASFYQPNAVLVAPDGDIFVAEGHGGPTSRITKFTKDGKFIKQIGKKGSGHVEFDQPHALAMDSRGRLFVADRVNNRIQILDQDGNFIAEWKQFSRPSGLFINKHDNIYVADSESGCLHHPHGDWKRGIRIGDIKDGKVVAFIPDPTENAQFTSGAEGVAVDASGVIYGAEVTQRDLKRYVRK